MVKVFLHTRKIGERDWVNEDMEFVTMPRLGENIKPSIDAGYFEVRWILHTPFRTDMDAEVYAVEPVEDTLLAI
jgi:hypothetical protein